MGTLEQTKMIDAAAEVGVKRFIPSEYGADRSKRCHPDFEKMQERKSQVLAHLKKKSEENTNLTWTYLASGPFLDWVSKNNLPTLDSKIVKVISKRKI